MTNSPISAVFGAAAASGAWSGLVITAAMMVSLDGGLVVAPMIFLIGTLYSSLICLISVCTLGLAWHTIALSRGWRSWKGYVLTGSLCGALSAIGLTLLSQSDQIFATLAFLICWFASAGAIAAISAWLIRRPDRDARTNPPTSPP